MTRGKLASGAESQVNNAGALPSNMSTYAMKVEKANQKGKHAECYSRDVLDMTSLGIELIQLSTKNGQN